MVDLKWYLKISIHVETALQESKHLMPVFQVFHTYECVKRSEEQRDREVVCAFRDDPKKNLP